MKTNRIIIWIAAAFSLLTACQVENLGPEESLPAGKPVDKDTWTLVVEASKGAGTKALAVDGEYLNATWSTSESVVVMKGGKQVGTLHPRNDGPSTKLDGELSGTFALGDELALLFPKEVTAYSGQKGTLADIAANYDFATDTVKVLAVDEDNRLLTTDVAVFVNKQAITKFVFNKPVTSLTIGAAGLAGSPLTVTPDSPAKVLYVAMTNKYEGKQLYNITAEVNGEAWVATKRASLKDGSFYEADVTLEKYDPLTTPLCFEAYVGGEISIVNGCLREFQYSKDRTSWVTTSERMNRIPVEAGECVYFRGKNASYGSYSTYGSSALSISGDHWCYGYVHGNVMSLIDSTQFSTLTEFTEDYALMRLFNGGYGSHTKDHNLKRIVLPATTLTTGCYYDMFHGTGISVAPELPARELAEKCYQQMFQGCDSLVSVPDLPGEMLVASCYDNMFSECHALKKAPAILASSMATYANYCCQRMFYGCEELVAAPSLPITEFWKSDGCYQSMFFGCTSLVNAPQLPATNLSSDCYNGMFSGCTSLKKAPALPATVFDLDYDFSCYRFMFADCTSLETAPDLPATAVTSLSYSEMFRGCTSLKNAPEISATYIGYHGCMGMFQGCTSLTQAPELPASFLETNSYRFMFEGCTSLVQAPELPATVIGPYCYCAMFSGCTSLVSGPQTLPATTLDRSCYASMFTGCSSLINAPSLPATELATYKKLNSYNDWGWDYHDECYKEMFSGCTSLVNAPELPATILSWSCYEKMFLGCTNLKKAPTLPATVFISGCYVNMFNGCSQLNYVKCLATELVEGTTVSSYAQGMLSGVAETGTFVKAAAMDGWGDVIPSGWKVVDAQ